MADNRKPVMTGAAKAGDPGPAERGWWRIPDGIKVRHRVDGQEGVIEGLTAIVGGGEVNPDGRTQYRVNTGAAGRRLVAEVDLLILADRDGLVQIARESADYRRHITERLRTTFGEDRFVR